MESPPPISHGKQVPSAQLSSFLPANIQSEKRALGRKNLPLPISPKSFPPFSRSFSFPLVYNLLKSLDVVATKLPSPITLRYVLFTLFTDENTEA